MDISVKDLGVCNYNIALSKQEFTREKLIKKTGKDTLILLEHNHTVSYTHLRAHET